VFEMFDCIEGLERIPPARRQGVPGFDMVPRFRVVGRVGTPDGFGLVEDFEALRALAPGRVLKVAIPGPLTFAMPLDPGGRDAGEVATRIRRCLQHVPADKLTVTGDCEFSVLPRLLARANTRELLTSSAW